jgi:GTP pyrophosphokinase
MIRQYELIDKVLKYNPQADVALLNRSYVYSMKAHGNQKRSSGEPYLTHPLAVAEILADLHMDEPTIAVGLLHDTLEDTLSTYDELLELFGQDVADLTEGVTKLSRVKFNTKAAEQAENFRKLLLAMSQDIRVLIVKLADRLHNIRTLHHVPKPEKRIAKARETMEIFAPLADRIGLHAVKVELEEICYEVMQPDEYQRIQKQLEEMRQQNDVVEKVLKMMREDMKKAGIEADVAGREKTAYSIQRKMMRKNLTFDQITDIIAYRVIVPTKADCYEVLGLMHDIYKAIPGRFKDYISSPKPNGYQSLHTSVIGLFGNRMEVQIRTKEMHEVAEYGIAAHFQYKNTGDSRQTNKGKEGAQYKWLKQLVDQLQETQDPEEFFAQAKLDLFSDSVFVFTPGGDLIHLPRGATPLDFAYHIHSDVGNRCQSAKVNGRIVPLKYKLNNGDQVEVVTNKGQTPSPAWKDIVVTGRARSAINRFISIQEREKQLEEGKLILERAVKKEGHKVTEKHLQKNLGEFKFDNLEDMYVALSQGRFYPRQIFAILFPQEYEEKEEGINRPEASQQPAAKKGEPEIDGLTSGMAVQISKCCNPLPGEEIVGVVTTGRGVSVHRKDCPNMAQYEEMPERLLPISWSADVLADQGHSYAVRLRIALQQDPGALASLTTAIFNANGNVIDLNVAERKADHTLVNSEVEVQDGNHYQRLMAAIRALNCVVEVERLKG